MRYVIFRQRFLIFLIFFLFNTYYFFVNLILQFFLTYVYVPTYYVCTSSYSGSGTISIFNYFYYNLYTFSLGNCSIYCIPYSGTCCTGRLCNRFDTLVLNFWIFFANSIKTEWIIYETHSIDYFSFLIYWSECRLWLYLDMKDRGFDRNTWVHFQDPRNILKEDEFTLSYVMCQGGLKKGIKLFKFFYEENSKKNNCIEVLFLNLPTWVKLNE